MRILTLLLIPLLCAIAASCATTSARGEPTVAAAAPVAGGAIEAKPELSALRFAWPAGASALVTEESLKEGRTAKLSYRIDVDARDGGGITVQIKELQFLEFASFDLQDPQTAAVVEALERRAMAAMPAFLVSADGEFEDITDYERLIEMVLQQNPEEERAEMGRTLRHPRMQAFVREGISKIWFTWAGVWAGQGLAQRHVVEVDTTVEAGSASYTLPARYEHKGEAEGHPGHVKLAFTTTLKGEAANAVLRETMGGVMQAAVPENEEASQEMQEALREMTFSKVTNINATVDPATLLPLRCQSEETTTVVVDGERQDIVERHSYRFTWTLPGG